MCREGLLDKGLAESVLYDVLSAKIATIYVQQVGNCEPTCDDHLARLLPRLEIKIMPD